MPVDDSGNVFSVAPSFAMNVNLVAASKFYRTLHRTVGWVSVHRMFSLATMKAHWWLFGMNAADPPPSLPDRAAPHFNSIP
jgi:hypothetical protein